MWVYNCINTYLGVTFDLGGDQIVEYLGELGEVDVDQLSLQVQAKQREKIPLLNFNQLIISLRGEDTCTYIRS